MDDGRTFEDRLGFLRAVNDKLALHLLRAAQLAHDDPKSATVALRCFAEVVGREEVFPEGLRSKARLDEIIKRLRQDAEAGSGVPGVPAEVLDSLDAMRIEGCRGAHPKEPAPAAEVVLGLIGEAWEVGVRLHGGGGGGEEHEVPAFEPPTPAEGNAVFRDAVVGGAHGMGDATARYHVAKVLLARRRRGLAELKPGELFEDRRAEILELLGRALHEVPAARTEYAKLLQDQPSPSEDDLLLARDYLEWAARDDEGEALFLVGVAHLHGRQGFDEDVDQALACLDRAAAAEEPRAYNALAVIHRDGVGVQADPSLAREYARRSAEAGFPIGQQQYAWFLQHGVGGARDLAKALVWLRRSGRQGWPEAKFHLALLLMEGEVEPANGADAEDAEDAEALLAEACELRSVDALVWRAERELAKEDGEVAFDRVLTDLAWAEDSAGWESTVDLRAKIREVRARLERHLLSLPRSSPRRRHLSGGWLLFNEDGSRKYPTGREMLMDMIGWEEDDKGRRRPTDDFILATVRLQAGPGVSEERLRTEAAWAKRMIIEEMDAEDAAVPKVGRNERCPCGSGDKYKRCHGSPGRRRPN